MKTLTCLTRLKGSCSNFVVDFILWLVVPVLGQKELKPFEKDCRTIFVFYMAE